MIQMAEGIWKITYETPELFTPVSMQKYGIAEEALKQMGKDSGRKAALPFAEWKDGRLL